VPSLGAGEEPKGDAFAVFPAGTRREPAPEEPKQTNKPTNKQTDEPASEPTAPAAASPVDAPSFVIELAAARIVKDEAADTAIVRREADGLVTVRPKPEKRKNAQERAKERAKERGRDKVEATEVVALAPATVESAMAHPKPEKRKNAKERAKEKYAKKTTQKSTEDGTTPDTTAKAKSKVDKKAGKAKKGKTK